MQAIEKDPLSQTMRDVLAGDVELFGWEVERADLDLGAAEGRYNDMLSSMNYAQEWLETQPTTGQLVPATKEDAVELARRVVRDGFGNLDGVKVVWFIKRLLED